MKFESRLKDGQATLLVTVLPDEAKGLVRMDPDLTKQIAAERRRRSSETGKQHYVRVEIENRMRAARNVLVPQELLTLLSSIAMRAGREFKDCPSAKRSCVDAAARANALLNEIHPPSEYGSLATGGEIPDPAAIETVIAQLQAFQAEGVTHVLAWNSRGQAAEVTGFRNSREVYDAGRCCAVMLEAQEAPGVKYGVW